MSVSSARGPAASTFLICGAGSSTAGALGPVDDWLPRALFERGAYLWASRVLGPPVDGEPPDRAHVRRACEDCLRALGMTIPGGG